MIDFVVVKSIELFSTPNCWGQRKVVSVEVDRIQILHTWFN